MPFPLNEIPEYFTHVALAFCAPVKANASDRLATTWDFDSSFIYTKTQILEWVAELKATRGDAQKFLLSLMDTPDTHWSTDVDIPTFAKNIAMDIYIYDLDGIDIDAESGMSGDYVGTFVLLIQSIRKELDALALLHPTLPKRIISYTCYTGSDNDQQILATTKNHIDYLTTMAYWDNTSSAIQLFQLYATWIGNPKKVGVGVECPPNATNRADVIAIAQWLAANDYKTMMLWSATRDVTAVSGLAPGAYARTILAILSNPLLTYSMAEKYMLQPTPAEQIEKTPNCLELLCSGVKSLFCCLRCPPIKPFDDEMTYKALPSYYPKNGGKRVLTLS